MMLESSTQRRIAPTGPHVTKHNGKFVVVIETNFVRTHSPIILA